MLINLKKSYQQVIAESTEKYFLQCLEYSERVTPEQLKEMLLSIGYKIKLDFKYTNNLNDHIPHYLAQSVQITDIKTGQSAFHFEQGFSNRENLDKLQRIRREYIVYDKGRIWEL